MKTQSSTHRKKVLSFIGDKICLDHNKNFYPFSETTKVDGDLCNAKRQLQKKFFITFFCRLLA